MMALSDILVGAICCLDDDQKCYGCPLYSEDNCKRTLLVSIAYYLGKAESEETK